MRMKITFANKKNKSTEGILCYHVVMLLAVLVHLGLKLWTLRDARAFQAPKEIHRAQALLSSSNAVAAAATVASGRVL